MGDWLVWSYRVGLDSSLPRHLLPGTAVSPPSCLQLFEPLIPGARHIHPFSLYRHLLEKSNFPKPASSTSCLDSPKSQPSTSPLLQLLEVPTHQVLIDSSAPNRSGKRR